MEYPNKQLMNFENQTHLLSNQKIYDVDLTPLMMDDYILKMN